MSSIYGVATWSATPFYKRHDITLYNSKYYYALKDIPAGSLFSLTYWGGYTTYLGASRPYFLWIPSYGANVEHNPRVLTTQFGDGYEQRMADGINNLLLSFDFTFEQRGSNEAAAIIHFLTQRKGVETFGFVPPFPYNKIGLYACKNWSHTEVFHENHTIKARFEEKVK